MNHQIDQAAKSAAEDLERQLAQAGCDIEDSSTSMGETFLVSNDFIGIRSDSFRPIKL